MIKFYEKMAATREALCLSKLVTLDIKYYIVNHVSHILSYIYMYIYVT